MNQFENIENQLISSYESNLAAEGKELCKEVDSLLQHDEEFNIDKTEKYCHFCLTFRKDSLNKDFLIKIQKYKYNNANFRSIKYELNNISEVRENQKKSLEKLTTHL